MTEPRSISLFCADDPASACLALRVLGPARELGIAVAEGSRWQSTKLVDFQPEVVDGSDLVVVQRDFPRYAAAYEAVMARARAGGKPVIYELDDHLFELPLEHPERAYYAAARLPMLRAVLEASAVTVTSQALDDYLSPFNSRVAILPNCLDDSLWTFREPAAPDDSRPLVIGLMGSYTHAPDVKFIEPVLQHCLAAYGEHVRLKFWGQSEPPAGLAGQPNAQWENIGILDYAEFAAYFARQTCDIGLAPLRPSLFNASKSAIKFLEYSVIGAAGVYSRLPPYEGVIVDNQNGLLASNLDEWQACLTRLIEDPALRCQMARAAQESVRAHWLLSANAVRWAEVYRSAGATVDDARPAAALAALRLAERWANEREADLSQSAQEQLAHLTEQPSWQLAQSVQAARQTLAPLGSRRQQALDGIVRRLRRPHSRPPG